MKPKTLTHPNGRVIKVSEETAAYYEALGWEEQVKRGANTKPRSGTDVPANTNSDPAPAKS